MRSPFLATAAALAGLVLAAQSHAGGAISTEEPSSTSWLSAVPLLPEVADAPVCRADDPARRSARADTAAKIARIRTLLAAGAASTPQRQDGFRVVGNRGYNYGGDVVVDPSLIEFEAHRQLR